MVMNVVSSGPRTIKLTRGSRHDVKTIAIGPWVRKRLLIFDMGYFQGTLFCLNEQCKQASQNPIRLPGP